MKRTITWMSVGLLVGCSAQGDSMFTHQGQIMAQASGVVLSEDGSEGLAGMFGTTCRFDAQMGMLSGDFDQGGDEVVEDGNDSGVVLTRNKAGIHELSPYGGDVSAGMDVRDEAEIEFQSTEIEGVIAARWVGDDPVALSFTGDACTMHWLGEHGSTLQLESAVCDQYTGMTVDPTSGNVFVGHANGIILADALGFSEWLDTGVDTLVWDGVTNVLYVTMDDGRLLLALEDDGQQRWSYIVPSGVTAISHMGPMGAVVAMERGQNDRGILAVYDGVTGDGLESVPTPSAANGLAISPNGSTLAIVVDEYVHLFGVNN